MFRVLVRTAGSNKGPVGDKGDIGPTFTIPSFRRGGQSRKITMSISKMGFNAWERTKTLRNVVLFASSFMYERMMLVFNDTVVALTSTAFDTSDMTLSTTTEVEFEACTSRSDNLTSA